MIERQVFRRLRTGGVLAAAVGGAVLLAWSLRHAGTTAVVEGVKRVGAGMIVILFLGGLRGLVRAAAWRLCLDREHQRSLAAIFSAYLAGDAIGNITPFGFLISEPSKIVLVRRLIDVPAAVAALTVENLCYGATVVVMLVAGSSALLLSFAVPQALQIASLVLLASAIVLAVLGAWITLTHRRVVSGAVEWLIRRRIAVGYLEQRLPHIRQTGERIFGFVARRREAVLPIILLEASYHVVAVLEIWYTLGLIMGVRPSLLTSFVLEYVNRAITIAFQFVPMALGVDEAGTSVATSVLHLGPAPGVSLALVRKARVGVWTAVGVVILLLHGLSINRAADEARMLAERSAGGRHEDGDATVGSTP